MYMFEINGKISNEIKRKTNYRDVQTSVMFMQNSLLPRKPQPCSHVASSFLLSLQLLSGFL